MRTWVLWSWTHVAITVGVTLALLIAWGAVR